MTNEIVKGIARALHAAYPAQEIYQNRMEQGLKEPCFFIQTIDSSISRLGTDRWRYSHQFDVIWFPEDSGDNAAMGAMALAMARLLEFIDTPNDGKLLGTGIRWEIEDGALHFYIGFGHTARRTRASSGDTITSVGTEITLRKGE